ncbi:MAG: hypothetical protein LBT71_00790 [Azoarcus sp.]|jgi:hypothetical protein|nr:hypothetical protein [Azoarcus sp.]
MRHTFIKTTFVLTTCLLLTACHTFKTSGQTYEQQKAERESMREVERELLERRKSYIMAYMKNNKIRGEPIIHNILPLALTLDLPPPPVSTSLDAASFHASAHARSTPPFGVSPSIPVYDGAAADELTKLINSGKKNIVVTSSDSRLAELTLEEALDRIEAPDEAMTIYLQSDKYRGFIVGDFAATPPGRETQKKRETQEEREARKEREAYEYVARMHLLNIPVGAKANAKNIVLKFIPQ